MAELLEAAGEPLTPQEIRERIKAAYPGLYNTDAQQRSVARGHTVSIDHALLSQIYTATAEEGRFVRDRSTKPMRISLAQEDEEPIAEDLEKDVGVVYILSTGLYTKDGREIVKIGFTTQEVDVRIAQLYTTGSPFRFQVKQVVSTKNYVELERALHHLLQPFRVNQSREFFTEEAVKFVDGITAIHQEALKMSGQF